jgi:hypothetical protein
MAIFEIVGLSVLIAGCITGILFFILLYKSSSDTL